MDSGQVVNRRNKNPNPTHTGQCSTTFPSLNSSTVVKMAGRRSFWMYALMLSTQMHGRKVATFKSPHSHVLSVLDSLPKKTDILIHCKSGMRSQLAAIELIQAGWAAERLYNLDGGIMGWHAAVPDDIE